jgi:peptidyl-prolyl cis-trans isomerase SDCCAG10
MSAIYNLEPQPTASAILHTTQGDLSVELFAKQTPLTCRNFLQLCLDGYYDNTIFHRLVPGFILQGGDPTGTGSGGESIYDGGALSGEFDPWPMDQRLGKNAGSTGVGFKDEFHSRLKFHRRGLLGMANESAPDTNGSQFFFTLGKADELSGKNTVFGRIAGDTIYNLTKIGDAEVDETTERPLYPVKITSVEILVNPFDDMRKRTRVAPQSQKPVVVEKKKKRKGGKQLLSFGDDEGDAEELPILKKAKFDARIVMDLDEEPMVKEKAPKTRAEKESRFAKEPVPLRVRSVEMDQPPSLLPFVEAPKKKEEARAKYDSDSPEPEPVKKKSALEQTNEEIAALKASMKRTVHAEPERVEKKSALEQLIPETSVRGRKRRPGGKGATANEEQRALDMLKAFQSKLNRVPTQKEADIASAPKEGDDQAAPADDEEAELCDLHFIADCQSCRSWDKAGKGEESDDEGWMSHGLSFKADKLGKDLSYRKKAEEELIVIDPREKSRTLKEERKADREARAGNTGRAWDQARNAQMARAATLAGRGAR